MISGSNINSLVTLSFGVFLFLSIVTPVMHEDYVSEGELQWRRLTLFKLLVW